MANWTAEDLERLRKNGHVRVHRMPDTAPIGRPKAGARRTEPAHVQTAPRVPESAVIRACGQILRMHPKVAKFWRQNTGAVDIEGRFVRFGEPGISDYVGFLTDGRFLAVECKSSRGTGTPKQLEFLGAVSAAGGFAWIGADAAKLKAMLDDA